MPKASYSKRARSELIKWIREATTYRGRMWRASRAKSIVTEAEGREAGKAFRQKLDRIFLRSGCDHHHS